ncbi:potassium transporter Trk [Halobacteria archaeon HArc-gm2]|nr:potassium transporter Trk [Halobacteria archaeon HArc-gm2]
MARFRVGSQDVATIARDVGALLAMQAVMMAITAVIAVAFREFYVALGFVLAAGFTGGIGGFLRWELADARPPKMKHGMIIAAAGWFTTAFFGALPFFFSAHLVPAELYASFVPAGATWDAASVLGVSSQSSLVYFRNPLHAMFESMSGWTGSGLTMASHEPSLPRAIQWWRSFIQYVGGVGVIVLTVSILARPGSGSYALYRSEAREEKIHPSIISTVRTVWRILLIYTFVSIVLLFGAIRMSDYGSQLPLWEAGWQAVNHAMTGLTTGGFSVTDNSIGTYNSPLIEFVLLPIMTAGAIAFPIHYVLLYDRDYSQLWDDVQTRWLFLLLGGGIVVLSLQNLTVMTDAFQADWVGVPVLALAPTEVDAIRDSTFQFVSALSCTGFQSAPIGDWGPGAKVILSGTMTLGGAAGSTVGGIKIIRGYLISRGIQWEFSRVFLPASAVVTATIGDKRLNRDQMTQEFSEAAIVSMLWLLILLTSTVVLVNLVGPSYDYTDVLFEVASAQGNVGLSSGITGPTMPPLAETMFLFNMWIGRLEIIPVLVFARSLIYGLRP